MPAEIERKFLVGEPPPQALESPSEEIDQGYVASDGAIEVRLRRKGGVHFITVKKGHGEVREETEVEITAEQFKQLWPQTEGWRVEKRRHRIPLDDGLIAEMDIYGGDLSGLVTVEVEYTSEETSRAFVAPEWFGREVTGDVEYSNQQMALNGAPAESPRSP
jgi:CYTH domain-containing protein